MLYGAPVIDAEAYVLGIGMGKGRGGNTAKNDEGAA